MKHKSRGSFQPTKFEAQNVNDIDSGYTSLVEAILIETNLLMSPCLTLKPCLHKQWLFQFFVTSNQFCQAVRLILPGSLIDFEIGIFLSLSDFVQCAVCQSDAYKNRTDGQAKSVGQ